MRVYPSLKGLRRLELAARFIEKSSGFRALRREGGGDEFEALREYQPDDEFRRIDWKATAWRHRPVTRSFAAERNQSVMLCVETGRGMAASAGGLSKLDRAVNASLLLAYAAIRTGDQVGLLVFSDEIETFLPPKKGHPQFRRILRALYAVASRPRFIDYRQALRVLRAIVRRRALLVFFTDVLGEEASAPLVRDVRSLAARHLSLLVAIDDVAVRAPASSDPSTAARVFEQAAAIERLHERDAILHAFRAAGGLVLDAAPEKIGTEVVNRSLELKRTRRM